MDDGQLRERLNHAAAKDLHNVASVTDCHVGEIPV